MHILGKVKLIKVIRASLSKDMIPQGKSPPQGIEKEKNAPSVFSVNNYRARFSIQYGQVPKFF